MTGNYTNGKTTLTPIVILTIARMAALEVEGVRGMAAVHGGFPKLKTHGKDGVSFIIEDDNVFVDIFLVVDGSFNFRDISRNVQHQVSRAISEMTGLEVSQVNIHIEDVVFVNDEAV